MKTLTMKLTLFVLFLTLIGSVPASAQVTINSTTLSAAVAPQAAFVSIVSATCTGCTFGEGTTLYVNLEQMIVARTYTSGVANIPVIRQMGSAAHASGATVFLGPANRFQSSDPPNGMCNRALQGNGFYPWINVKTGAEWLCDSAQASAYVASALWRVLYPYVIGTVAASR